MAKCRARNLDYSVYDIMKTYMCDDPSTMCDLKVDSVGMSSPSATRLSPSCSPQRCPVSQNVAAHPLESEPMTPKSSSPSREKPERKSGRKTSRSKPSPPKLSGKVTSEKGSMQSSKKQKKPKSLRGVPVKKLTGKTSSKSPKTSKQRLIKDSQNELMGDLLDLNGKMPFAKGLLSEDIFTANFVQCDCDEEIRRMRSVDRESKSMEKLKKDLTEAKGVLKDKVDKVQSQAVKTVTKMAYDNCMLSCAVKARDDHIATLTDTADKLAKDMEEKDQLCKRLIGEQENLKYRMQECSNRNNSLMNAKDRLAKIVDEQQIRIDALVFEVESLQRNLAVSTHEIGVGVSHDTPGARCSSGGRRERDLEKQIQQLRHDELQYLDEIEKYKSKLARMKNEQTSTRCKCDKKLQALQKENTNLIAANRQLIDKMRTENSELIWKSDQMQLEFKKMAQAMSQKESTLLKERDQLKSLAKELTDITKKQNKRIDELIALNQIQENALHQQKAELASKGEQVMISRRESETLRQKYEDLEKEFSSYRQQNNASKAKTKECDKLTCELAEAKAAAKKACDALSSKEKIIGDQLKTIQQQRCGMQELKDLLEKRDAEFARLQEEVKDVNNQLTKEIANNANVKKSLMEVRKLNEQLWNQMEGLSKAAPPKTCEGDVGRMHSLISSLEEQVTVQRRQWEMEKQAISREKSRAETAAHYSTRRLLETSKDLHQNAAMHRHVQHLLIGMLQEKEDQLKTVRSKVLTMLNTVHIGKIDPRLLQLTFSDGSDL